MSNRANLIICKPEDEIICGYCGHTVGFSEFLTNNQIKYHALINTLFAHRQVKLPLPFFRLLVCKKCGKKMASLSRKADLTTRDDYFEFESNTDHELSDEEYYQKYLIDLSFNDPPYKIRD